jgi:hypothetical protein
MSTNTLDNLQQNSNRSKIFRWVFILACLGLLIALILCAVLRSPDNNINIKNSTVAISVIGAIAVGIERIIEAIWSMLSAVGWDKWSYKIFLSTENQNFIDDIKNQLGEFTNRTQNGLKNTATKIEQVQSDVDNMQTILTNFASNLDEFKTTTILNPKLNTLAENSKKELENLGTKFKDLKTTTDYALRIVNIATDFITTFKENPLRRLFSIYLGLLLGLGFAALSGMDVIKATLETTIPGGVVWTGILMGLGSSPTHEVIGILNEIKENRKTSKNEQVGIE